MARKLKGVGVTGTKYTLRRCIFCEHTSSEQALPTNPFSMNFSVPWALIKLISGWSTHPSEASAGAKAFHTVAFGGRLLS